MAAQMLFWASTFRRRIWDGNVSGANSVHCSLTVSNLASLPEFHSAIQMLSFRSAITPYGTAPRSEIGYTVTFCVARSSFVSPPPMIHPTYRLTFESRAIDCIHRRGLRMTLAGSAGILYCHCSVFGLK